MFSLFDLAYNCIFLSSFLEYLIEKASADISEQEICQYLNDSLRRESCHFESDLPELVRWKMKQKRTSMITKHHGSHIV